MKILTRYILLAYFKNYLISLFVLIGLYVVLDMVFNFDEFTASRDGGAWAAIGNVAEYYFYQSVAAAAFTFLRLARFNELTAMMAAGIPLVRVATPAIICATVLSLLFPLVNQELIIPNITAQLTRDRSDPAEGRPRGVAIQAMQDDQGGLLFAAKYEPPTLAKQAAEMTEMIVLTPDHERDRASFIEAKSAFFNPQTRAWELAGGLRNDNIGLGLRQRNVEPIDVYQSNITPEEIALFQDGNFVNLLSTQRINELLQRTQIYGANDLLRVWHARFTQLMLNMVLVLLAISCVLIREAGQLKYAVVKCIVVVGACMGTIFVCQSLAGDPPANFLTPDRWAALMAWLPLFIFGPLAILLLERVKS
jgi:lipopolysaccharide export system permease protein